MLSLFAVVLTACAGETGGRVTAVPLRGPITKVLRQAPASLSECRQSGVTFARPYWRAPYVECSSEVAGRKETIMVDADSVVTDLYSTETVPSAKRASAFASLIGELTSAFGPPHRCAPTKYEWKQGDSLHVVAQITAGSDVGPAAAGPWRVVEIIRLGPLDARTWACG